MLLLLLWLMWIKVEKLQSFYFYQCRFYYSSLNIPPYWKVLYSKSNLVSIVPLARGCDDCSALIHKDWAVLYENWDSSNCHLYLSFTLILEVILISNEYYTFQLKLNTFFFQNPDCCNPDLYISLLISDVLILFVSSLFDWSFVGVYQYTTVSVNVIDFFFFTRKLNIDFIFLFIW